MNDIRFPDPFERRMREKLKDDWSKFANAHQEQSPISIRINPAKQFQRDKNESVPWSDHGMYLKERPIFTLDPHFHAGAYYVQEASSMFLEQVIRQTSLQNQTIRALDLCAAPGGKSTHLLSLLSKESLLVSNEVIRSRASILAENIQKWGHNNVVVTNSDPEKFGDLEGFFDLIVLDAPCSGEGLFRKDPDAMTEWSEDNVALCSGRQKRILGNVWPALKQDGVLIYCTCTYNESENEDNLDWLNENQSVEFLSLDIQDSWGIEKIQKKKAIGYRFYPHNTKGEGFFISVIRKLEDQRESRIKPGKKVFSTLPKPITSQLESWVKEPADKSFQQFKDDVLMFPAAHHYMVEFLSTHLHMIQAGTALGSVKHDKIIPDTATALSIDLNQTHFQSADVGLEDALHYLRKDNLVLSGLTKGFTLVRYQGNPLGWINVLDNRINNLYPANWRIRMGG
jgi:16S rRNA C967 or C1407 C5-methylase (RsmB/RsmF family)/NOL1/NOP2/fmu family ribosome biogenesis protein